MMATLFKIAFSAADIIASVMWFIFLSMSVDKFTFSYKQKVREKSRECHNYKPQPFPDTNKRTKKY